MDTTLRDGFIELWNTRVPGAELPLVFFYTNDPGEAVAENDERRCVVARLNDARRGETVCLTADSTMCPGGKRYLGFSQDLMPGFEHFLSCGIPGQMEGERYKKSPQLVKDYMQQLPVFEAPGKYVVFKRWDLLEAADEPEAVIFYAPPDVLSALFTLANFDEPDLEAVVAPFGAGCATIVQYPYLEQQRERPRAILGMFDVSARPYVPRETVSFAVPMPKFARMVANMEESFLITGSWDRVKARLG